jgi:hypothetical protein
MGKPDELLPLANGDLDASAYEGKTKKVDYPSLERRVVSSNYFRASFLVLGQLPIFIGQ